MTSALTHTRRRGAVKQVLELYKSGFSPREIALRVYGDDSLKFRQRVFSIIYWYGKRLGLLNTHQQYDPEHGEFVDVETGTVVESEVRDGFVPHASPVHPQDPFLGSYRTMQQLRASLPSSDRRAVDVLVHVDRLMGAVPDVPRESIIRQDACMLARVNAGLDTWLVKIAMTSVIVALLYHAPRRVREFVDNARVIHERIDPIKAVRECFEKGFTVPPPILASVVTRAVAILNGGT